MSVVVKNLHRVKKLVSQENIEKAFERYSLEKPPSYTPPQIIAVSKSHTKEKILELIQAGHFLFGENKVQEAQQKFVEIKQQFPKLKLHFIGPLQTNKTKQAVSLFDFIHTVDREKIAVFLKKEFENQKKTIPLLIQVNTGKEENKAGILPKDAGDFINFCVEDLSLPIKGLMCVPPVDEPASVHFSLLSDIAKKHNLNVLSMGMSNDFELASVMGSSFIRVGTKIFGQR